MKTIFILLISSISIHFYAQVGINTSILNGTLDVSGKPDDHDIPDGIIAPRLSLEQLNSKNVAYDSDQTGAIAYVTDINLSVTPVPAKVKYVTTPGYYLFNGEYWETLEPQTGDVVFRANIGQGNGIEDSHSQKISYYEFTTVKLNPVENIGGGVWDPVENTYTIPNTGTYIVTARIRPSNSISRENIFINVGGKTEDSPRGLWGYVSNTKYTLSFFRTLYFTKGEAIRLVTFFDGSDMVVADATLSISLLSSMGGE